MSERYKVFFYAAVVVPGSIPECMSNPTTEFESIEDARSIGRGSAKWEGKQPNTFEIETLDQKVRERWVRDGDAWRQEHAKRLQW